MIDDPTNEAPGTITVDTANFLYYSLPNRKAVRYGVATGKEAFSWTGRSEVKRMAEWPHWMPPADMLERWPHLKPTAAAGGLPGGSGQSAGRTRALPLPGQQGHAVPHPRHQQAKRSAGARRRAASGCATST